MAVGLKHGRARGDEDNSAARDHSRKILLRFQEEMGSDICRELTGMDLSTAEGYRAFRQSDVPERVCRRCIGTAARLGEEQLAS
jgi:hypothetical protein